MPVILLTFIFNIAFTEAQSTGHQLQEDTIFTKSQFLVSSNASLTKPSSTVSYGILDQLAEPIVSNHILSNCDCNVLQVNRAFFTLLTGFSSDHILDKGLASKPGKHIFAKLNRATFRLTKIEDIERISSFTWYTLIGKLIYQYFDEFNEFIDFGQILQGTNITILDLTDNKINANHAYDLGQALQGTALRVLNLTNNRLGPDGARDLGQALRKTNIHTVYLEYNYLGTDGARDLFYALDGTKVHTLYLEGNFIGYGNVGALGELGQALKMTNIQTLYLDSNFINADKALALTSNLKDTKVAAIYLSKDDFNIRDYFVLTEAFQRVDITLGLI